MTELSPTSPGRARRAVNGGLLRFPPLAGGQAFAVVGEDRAYAHGTARPADSELAALRRTVAAPAQASFQGPCSCTPYAESLLQL